MSEFEQLRKDVFAALRAVEESGLSRLEKELIWDNAVIECYTLRHLFPRVTTSQGGDHGQEA